MLNFFLVILKTTQLQLSLVILGSRPSSCPIMAHKKLIFVLRILNGCIESQKGKAAGLVAREGWGGGRWGGR